MALGLAVMLSGIAVLAITIQDSFEAGMGAAIAVMLAVIFVGYWLGFSF